ncbi:LysM peptidoglycan-binding domain-containing protein [Deinococcus sp.]|uniref:LysM peptidoglycan-binding domain-containing protein n=1 Tax=Deinococcus sp. TaxID=47478 RepID=UPI0025F6D6D3|nr:LysM peptidoglycan-binding domain-containing protein [Deinococcus sp.]
MSRLRLWCGAALLNVLGLNMFGLGLFGLGLFGGSALAAVSVKPHQTLYAISRASGTSVARLRLLNHLSGDQLKVGQLIRMGGPARLASKAPGPSVKTASVASGTPHPALNAPSKPPLRLKTTWLRGAYTVRRGDTLSKLSRRSGLDVGTLRRSNHLTSSVLSVGQRLRLVPGAVTARNTPNQSAAPRPRQVSPRPTSRNEPRTVFTYSVVGQRDTFRTLSQVAQHSAQFSPAQLMRLNKLASPWVYPGMKLLMPRRVSVPVPPKPQRAGATLQSLWVLGIALKVVRVDLRYRNVLVSPILPAQGLGTGARVNTLARLSGATAVINGSYFHPQSFIPAGDLVVRGQRLAWGRLPAALSITPDNRAYISSGAGKNGVGGSWAGMESVVASGPQIVRGGAVQSRYPAVFQDPALFGRAARSAIGLSSNRDLMLVSTRTRLSITEMGKVMAALGARDALLLDGGSSAGLSWNRSPVIESVRGVSYGIGVFVDYSGRRYSRL